MVDFQGKSWFTIKRWKEKLIPVHISTMDSDIDFNIQAKAKGLDLYELVCKILGIRESWFFGLQYKDENGDNLWLRMNKKLTDQCSRTIILNHNLNNPVNKVQNYPCLKATSECNNHNGSSINELSSGGINYVYSFELLVKFYPEDIEEIIQNCTLHLFFLQVSNAVLNMDIYCPPEASVLLASYSLQAKYGDFDETKFHTVALPQDTVENSTNFIKNKQSHSNSYDRINNTIPFKANSHNCSDATEGNFSLDETLNENQTEILHYGVETRNCMRKRHSMPMMMAASSNGSLTNASTTFNPNPGSTKIFDETLQKQPQYNVEHIDATAHQTPSSTSLNYLSVDHSAPSATTTHSSESSTTSTSSSSNSNATTTSFGRQAISELPARVLNQYHMTESMWEVRIKKWYEHHRGMPREEAELEYLKIVQDLDMYGIQYFDIYNKKKSQLWLGVSAIGLNVYEKDNKLVPKIFFPWNEIRTVSADGKKFTIRLLDKGTSGFVFYAHKTQTIKLILELFVGNHDLYIRRRKPDPIEIQQMKIQAREEKSRKQLEKACITKEQERLTEIHKMKCELERQLSNVKRENERINQALKKSEETTELLVEKSKLAQEEGYLLAFKAKQSQMEIDHLKTSLFSANKCNNTNNYPQGYYGPSELLHERSDHIFPASNYTDTVCDRYCPRICTSIFPLSINNLIYLNGIASDFKCSPASNSYNGVGRLQEIHPLDGCASAKHEKTLLTHASSFNNRGITSVPHTTNYYLTQPSAAIATNSLTCTAQAIKRFSSLVGHHENAFNGARNLMSEGQMVMDYGLYKRNTSSYSHSVSLQHDVLAFTNPENQEACETSNGVNHRSSKAENANPIRLMGIQTGSVTSNEYSNQLNTVDVLRYSNLNSRNLNQFGRNVNVEKFYGSQDIGIYPSGYKDMINEQHYFQEPTIPNHLRIRSKNNSLLRTTPHFNHFNPNNKDLFSPLLSPYDGYYNGISDGSNTGKTLLGQNPLLNIANLPRPSYDFYINYQNQAGPLASGLTPHPNSFISYSTAPILTSNNGGNLFYVKDYDYSLPCHHHHQLTSEKELELLNGKLEKERTEYVEKCKTLRNQLYDLRKDFETLKVADKESQLDKIHADAQSRGENKYSTLKKVRVGTMKSRVDFFEEL